jgi:cyclophilin family peptidyl-prolyl cis-trans isomerase
MKKKAIGFLSLILLGTQAQAAPWVRVTTNMGEFVIEVNPQRAPLTTANFIRYVNEGFYSGTLFHRVVSNFVVQGGGYAAGSGKPKPPHESIPNESGNGLQNLRGTVGLARTESAHSGNCQFYVNLADNPDLDPVPTRWGYAVFGKVVQGMDVLERMGVLPTGAAEPFKSDAPLQQVLIVKAEVLNSPPTLTPAPAAPASAPAPATATATEASAPAPDPSAAPSSPETPADETPPPR